MWWLLLVLMVFCFVLFVIEIMLVKCWRKDRKEKDRLGQMVDGLQKELHKATIRKRNAQGELAISQEACKTLEKSLEQARHEIMKLSEKAQQNEARANINGGALRTAWKEKEDAIRDAKAELVQAIKERDTARETIETVSYQVADIAIFLRRVEKDLGLIQERNPPPDDEGDTVPGGLEFGSATATIEGENHSVAFNPNRNG